MSLPIKGPTKTDKRAQEAKELAARWPISVVIPGHNAAAHLESCLKALAANNLENTEIVFVDDRSTDRSSEIAARFGCRCIQTGSRQGPAAARNLGFKQAVHPHLLFLDSDVVLLPDALTRVREALDLYAHRPDVAGVLGQYAEELPWTDFFTNYKNLAACYLYRITETQSPFLHTAMFCISRTVFEESGGFDPHLTHGEDFRLGTLLGSRGYRFIIDRNVNGQHLKRYSFVGILREDWRRVRQLASIRLPLEERRFSYRAHRWNRLLSVVLPGVTVACLALAVINPLFLRVSAVLLLGFFLLNLPFLLYCRRKRGIWFALRAGAFLFLEMLWAELALAVPRKLRK
ncbi:MAG: glycosyltransferase family 2 protein [Acidobacteria bacterium]|nr:MAG: glycosyltransferase family 2 protein [Acidobacteriota bacterium]